MLTALDIPHRYLRSLVYVGAVGLITSVERGAVAVRRKSDVHGARRRQRGPGRQYFRLATVRKRTSENPNFDSECFC